MKSDFLKTLETRGYISQCTNIRALDEAFIKGKVCAYVGFDCTAKSLHIGSLIQIMVLRYLQKFDHKPLILLGGSTTKIGDPSGKDKSRSMLSDDQIDSNIASISSLLDKFIISKDFLKIDIVNNSQWLDDINYLSFLRDIGRHFSVNKMLNFDSVRLRIEREQNLSFLEFNYMLLQAYDFVELNKRYGCILQIGGSDQWGNIINGVDLGNKLRLPQLFGLTTPLILNSCGEKMGKTSGGKTVWLTEEMFSAYDYWQYFRNIDDKDIGTFLKLFTELPIEEIKELERLQGDEINEAKKILANEATKICHGFEKSQVISKDAEAIFERGSCSEMLIFELNKDYLLQGISLAKLLLISGMEATISEAKRLIKGGGCKINNVVIKDINIKLQQDIFSSTDYIKLSCGKKRHIKIILTK